MSNQWYYNCDGRTGGPVSQVQLQLLVNSGTLLPHHQVRRGDMPNWTPARSIRGLFSPSQAAAESIPQAAPVAVAAPVTEPETSQEPPFGFLGQSASADGPPSAEVFNFFADPGPAPAPAPTPPPKPAAKPPQPNRRAPEPAKVVALAENDEPVALAEDATPLPSVAPAKPAAEARQPEPMKSPELKAPELATPGAAAAILEVSGTAVELLPDGTVLVLEGKTSFRLHRAWLLATTKFAGGASQTTYLRLQRMDGASVEQLYGPGPTRRGPYLILSFHAGELHVALRFEGLDKPYRAFAEKVLLQSHAPNKHATAPGQ